MAISSASSIRPSLPRSPAVPAALPATAHGTTGRCPPFENDVVQALESHSFEPLKVMQWRNTDLDFSSIGALQASLAETPKENGLTRAPVAEDIDVLELAARDSNRGVARTPAAVARLWEMCQVPITARCRRPATPNW